MNHFSCGILNRFECTYLLLLALRIASDAESLDGELPVGLSGQGNVVDLRLAVLGVDGSVGDQTGISTVADGKLKMFPLIEKDI